MHARSLIAALAAVSVALVAAGVAAAGGGAASECSTPPEPVTARAAVAYASATLSQGTLIGTLVPALRPWADAQHAAGGRFAAWLARCGSGDAATPLPRLASLPALGLSPARARAAIAAARRYPVAMWGTQKQGWGSLVAAAVERGSLDGRPVWILSLVGPRPVDWRYSVVDDRLRVLSFQLTGSDAERLLHIEPQGGAQ